MPPEAISRESLAEIERPFSELLYLKKNTGVIVDKTFGIRQAKENDVFVACRMTTSLFFPSIDRFRQLSPQRPLSDGKFVTVIVKFYDPPRNTLFIGERYRLTFLGKKEGTSIFRLASIKALTISTIGDNERFEDFGL